MPRKGRRRTKVPDGEGGGGDDDGGDDGSTQPLPQLLDELPQPPPHQQQQQQQQNNHHHHHRAQASYDAAEDPRLRQVPVATEPIDGLNLRVLQNYEPTITSIEAIAASSVVYAFSSETGGWVKADPQIEGTLFLCEQAPLQVEHLVLPRACVFVLNRKGLINVMVDLAHVSAAEVTDGLITLVIDDEAGAAGNEPKVLGLWIHGNGAAGTGSGTDGPQFDPEVVVRRWQAIHASLQKEIGTSRLADTASILDAGVVVSKINLASRGLNPEGIATTAIGQPPHVLDVIAMVLNQTSGQGVAQEGL